MFVCNSGGQDEGVGVSAVETNCEARERGLGAISRSEVVVLVDGDED